MKSFKKRFFLAMGLSLVLSVTAFRAYSACIECTDGTTNNGKCYGDNCSKSNTQGGACCGNTAW